MRCAALLILLAVISGCSESRRMAATSSSEIAGEDLDAVADLLSHSYAYRRVQRTEEHPAWFIDGHGADYWEVALGNDLELNFVCLARVRVYRDGGLKRLDVVNDIWLDDRAPDNWRE